MDKNPETRLGTKGGFKEIMKHAFFKDIDIESILNFKVINNIYLLIFLDVSTNKT